MLYRKPRFTVPVVEKPPVACDHSDPWVTAKGLCVLCGAVLRVYGTWNNALGLCDLELCARPNRKRDAVLASLEVWRSVNGSLPSIMDFERPTRGPALPSYRMLLDALGVESFAAAMRSAEASLMRVAA